MELLQAMGERWILLVIYENGRKNVLYVTVFVEDVFWRMMNFSGVVPVPGEKSGNGLD
jgi:hypothetical protein